MPLMINTNTLSLNAQRNLGHNTAMLAKSMEKLSSGYRINRAGDDAAGLQLSEGLRAQIRGSQKALDNVLDGINVLNIADGALQSIGDNLQRIRELVVQAANDTYSTEMRQSISLEIRQLLHEIDRTAHSTTFNGVSLLDGTAPAPFNIQVGPGTTPDDVIDISQALAKSNTGSLDPEGLEIFRYPPWSLSAFLSAFQEIDDVELTDGNHGYFVLLPPFPPGTPGPAVTHTAHEWSQLFMADIDTGIENLNVIRGNLGALTNRLEGAANNLSISIENMSSAESRIRDVDVAAESAKLTQAQILQKASALILSQANQTPSLALQLLQPAE